MAKLNIGDIFEIQTSGGKAYLHYIYINEDSIELIRVLPGVYSERPINFDNLASSKENFMVYFPLSAAAKKK
jgi:hypothetical protein